MKAALYTAYGPPEVIQLREIEKPTPKSNEVLVKVIASSVNALEWRRFTLPRPMLRIFGGGISEPRDKSIGGDVAGTVEAVGSGVSRFQPGDEVFGIQRGAFAEYVCAIEDKLVPKPKNISFEAAAAVPIAALTALQAIRDSGKIQKGQKVLIYGAGGGVGTFAVQIAKAFGAEVDAVCGTRNVELMYSIGADRVWDYTREDFARDGQRYDLIVAVNGYRSILEYRRALKPKGTSVLIGGTFAQFFQWMFPGPLLSLLGSRKSRGMITRPNQQDLVALKELLESRQLVPVIDKCYPLAKTADAIRYLLAGHVRGKVVITNEGIESG